MANRRGLRFIALLAFTLSGCSQFEVRAKQDPAVDFGRLHTYAWLPRDEAEPADQRVNDRAVDATIRAATERELRGKGYRPADSGPADFLLNYRLSRSPADALRAYRPGYAAELWSGGWLGPDSVYYESYDEGTLYLAAVDRGTKRMIWLGAARARLLPHISFEKRMKRADAAVTKILGSFPRQ